MMNQMNLTSFNPLNIVNNGGNKVQHPAAGYSNTISQNVEGMHKEFAVFHKNLKNLVMLYKTRHQLMESLNENGLYTAKCYNEMFDGSPLSPIVAPGGHYEQNIVEEQVKVANADVALPPSSAPPSAAFESASSFDESEFVPNRASQPKTLQEKLASIGHDDDIDMTEYPESGVIREKLEPDEGSRIGKDLSKDTTREPEGLKASKKMSIYGTNASYIASGIKDKVEGHGPAKDPPSANSIGSGGDSTTNTSDGYERKKCADPPPTKSFPDDETRVTVEKNPLCKIDGGANTSDEMGDSVNFIVDDDDDSFTVPKENEIMAIEAERKEVEENAEFPAFTGVDGNEFKEKMKRDVSEDEHNYTPFPDIEADGPEIDAVSSNADTRSSGNSAGDENKDNTDYLNISNDGTLVVMKGSPEPEPQSQPAPSSLIVAMNFSYFDIHKDAYADTNSKLGDHSELVSYVEDWEQIVTKRVQSKYGEYAKHRNSLNHYAKKVDSLLAEEERLKDKGKQMKPKQLEKLDRNQDKLTGARETHDSVGESLLMLMDEVIVRSYRDVFPLLKKSISLEGDFAAINHKHMAKLGGSLELLKSIGEKETLGKSRLEEFQNMNPEDIYTGSGIRYSQGENK